MLAESDSASDQLMSWLSHQNICQVFIGKPRWTILLQPASILSSQTEETYRGNTPTWDHCDDAKLPHKLSSHALLYELLFTQDRFDTRCALISWRAQQARVSEAQN